jgi:cyclopropane-fatty-acyl-phospholipid synthase
MSDLPRDREVSGASDDAIRHHYDVGNEFYRLWLDRTMTYSAGLWGDAETLEDAQLRKLDLHLSWANVHAGSRVLDVGCGWGSLLERAVGRGARSAVGLTLSEEQYRYVRDRHVPGVTASLESWRDHKTDEPYDAVISIGALEHFVRPETSSAERVRTYAEFFSRCRELSRVDGWMSLQSIAYSTGSFVQGAIASIFPESDLPRLDQIESAIAGRYEIVQMRDDAPDYARTCRAWLTRLIENEQSAIRCVGESRVRHYAAFLTAASKGFDAGIFRLLRLQLGPV